MLLIKNFQRTFDTIGTMEEINIIFVLSNESMKKSVFYLIAYLMNNKKKSVEIRNFDLLQYQVINFIQNINLLI